MMLSEWDRALFYDRTSEDDVQTYAPLVARAISAGEESACGWFAEEASRYALAFAHKSFAQKIGNAKAVDTGGRQRDLKRKEDGYAKSTSPDRYLHRRHCYGGDANRRAVPAHPGLTATSADRASLRKQHSVLPELSRI